MASLSRVNELFLDGISDMLINCLFKKNLVLHNEDTHTKEKPLHGGPFELLGITAVET